MKRKKRDMTYNELHKFLADKYNDYQNVNIYDNNLNYMDTELANEMFDYYLYLDVENQKMK